MVWGIWLVNRCAATLVCCVVIAVSCFLFWLGAAVGIPLLNILSISSNMPWLVLRVDGI